MNDDDLRLQIKKLAYRLQRLERHVGIDAEAAADAPAQRAAPQPAAPPSPPAAPPLRPAAPPAPPAAPPRESMAPPVLPVARSQSTAAPPTAPVPPASPASASTPPRVVHAQLAHAPAKPPPTQPPKPLTGAIEFAIGIKVIGGIGAILVVIGAAFLAREYGANIWFSLPAVVQAAIIAGFGGLLLLGGEIALRTLGRPASLGLYGAGLGVLYMDAFAAFQWFQIVSQDAAFLLMGLVAACGFAITLRTKFLSIGVLSLLGGYIAPILLWRTTAGGIEVLAFLTMLAGIALALSAWQPRPFRPMRYVAFGGQCFLGLIAVAVHAQAQPVMILIFASIWWTMFTAEAVLAAMRRQSPTGNVIISLLSTAAYVTCSTWILNSFTTIGSDYLGAYTAMIAILCGVIALHFGPGLDGLRGRLETAMDKLAVALWAQMGILLAIAIAMQFDGFGPSVGWLALGLASIEIGRRLPSAGVSVFGLVVFGLGILRVVTFDQAYSPLQAIVWEAAGLRIDQWAILGLIAVLAIHTAAKRIGGRGEGLQHTMPALLAVVGAIGWFMLVARQADGFTLTSLWLGGAILLLATEQWNRRERYLEISLLMLLAVAAKWLLIDALARRLDPAWSATALTPLLNPQMGLAIAIAAAGWWGLRRIEIRRTAVAFGPSAGIAWQVAAIIGGVFLLIGLSFEVDRSVVLLAQARDAVAWQPGHMRQLMFTILWAFGSAGFGLLAMIFRREWTAGKAGGTPLLLRFAWGVLAAFALKWLLIDTFIYAFVLDRAQVVAWYPIGNVQMLAAVILMATAMFLLHVSAMMRDTTASEERPAWTPLRAFASIGACLVLLWGLTFEVDRLLGRMALDTAFAWSPEQLRAFWWSVLWATGGLLMMPLGT